MHALHLRKKEVWRKIPGVYRIWSQDRKLLYVGSTSCLDRRRFNHNTAILLGGRMEVVEEMPGSDRAERLRREDHYIRLFKEQGHQVMVGLATESLSINLAGSRHLTWKNRTTEERKAASQKRTSTAKANGTLVHPKSSYTKAVTTRRRNGNPLTPSTEARKRAWVTRKAKNEAARTP